MRKYCSVLFFLLLSLSVSAQKYRTAAGLRIGRTDFGASIQQKFIGPTTLEGIVALGTRELSATLLLERHYPIIGDGFNYYLGGGAHVGTLNNYGGFYGVDVILGTEIKLPALPLLLSLDIKPAVHVSHEDWFDLAGGLSVRYIFIKEKERKKRKLFDIFKGDRRDDNNRNRNNSRNPPSKKRLFNL